MKRMFVLCIQWAATCPITPPLPLPSLASPLPLPCPSPNPSPSPPPCPSLLPLPYPSPIPSPPQYSLPLELLNDVTMPGWMAVVERVVSRPTPPECCKVPEEEQLNTEWWKAKKWATRVLWRIFEQLVGVWCINTVPVLRNYTYMSAVGIVV